MSGTQIVSRPYAAGDQGDRLVRYTFAERLVHWLGALSYLYVLITGLAFWSPYLFWLSAIVGGGPVARFWHPIVGIVFVATVFWTFYEWHSDMKITEEDRAWSRSIGHYVRNEDDALPPAGRFNYGQKLFFWGMFWSVILLILSGLVLWFTEALPWNLRYLRYASVLIHAGVAMITIGLFLIHVYMSAILEKSSLPAMIEGTCSRAWARTFHRLWYNKVTGNTQP